MTRFIRSSVFGLLWLAVGATAFASSLTIQDQNFNVNSGGRLDAYFSNPQSLFEVFCVDYRNYVSPPETYDATITNGLSNLSAARYGTTNQTDFQFQTVPVVQPDAGQSLGDAVNRYLLAACLTTQYDFGPGANTGNQDLGIQTAIW